MGITSDHSVPADRRRHESRWMRHLACPLCAGALHIDQAVLRCTRGHAHAVGTGGWVDLQPPRAARPVTGDSAAMLSARARTVSRGWFTPLLEALTAAVTQPRSGVAVVDAGCGTGALLDALRSVLDPRGVADWVGTDVSRASVRGAAASFPQCGFVRADTRAGLPLLDGAASTVLSVFAPRNAAAFARVLQGDGQLLVVHANPGHMVELREFAGVLQVEPGKHERLLGQCAPWFRSLEPVMVLHRMLFDEAGIRDLVHMGPAAHHAGIRLVPHITPRMVTLDMCVARFVKRA